MTGGASPTPRTVGFIGLGVMGSAMSSHLLDAGYEVLGYDTDPARMAAHTDAGGTTASNPAEVGARADVVITSLPSADALTVVVHGADGLTAHPAPHLTVIETSTLPVDVKKAARAYLAEHRIRLADCPLSGTGEQARRKDLVAYLSGDDDAKARAAGVLRSMTRAVYDVGEFGNGSKMKVIANLLVAVHNVAAAEALLLAERAGLDLALVLAAVGDGAGTSRMFEVRGPHMAVGDYEPAIRTSVFEKDLDIIAAFARQVRSPTPLFTLATMLYEAALAQGRGDQDTACVHAVLRDFTTSRPGRLNGADD